MIEFKKSVDEDEEFRIKLEESLRKYDVRGGNSVYLMPSYYNWREFGKAVTNVGARPVFVDLETEVLELAHNEFPNSRCILHDITYPLDPLPEEKIHWVLIRGLSYIFRSTKIWEKTKTFSPGVSLALKSHRDYVNKLYISDLMTQKTADEVRKNMNQDILSRFPLDFEETIKLLDACGYRTIDVSPLKPITNFYEERRYIVAEPVK